jgi:GT2 family glycosyltransferase
MLIDYPLLRKIGFFDVDLPHYDGFELTLRLARQTQFVYLPEPLLDYRMHNTSSSTGLKAKIHLHDLRSIYKIMTPWLRELRPGERERIVKIWQQRLLRFQLRDAREKKSRMKAYAVLLLIIMRRNRGIGRQDLRQIISSEFPHLWPFS